LPHSNPRPQGPQDSGAPRGTDGRPRPRSRCHGGKAREVVVLEIAVPRAWLQRHGGAAQGLWYSTRDIATGHIRRVITFGELAPSPAEDTAG